MSLDSDPEIAAAFGGGPVPATAAPISDDPEIHAAFSEKFDGKKSAPQEDHKIGDELVQPVVAGLSGMLHSAIGGYKGLYTLATTRDVGKASQAVEDEQKKAYTYTPPARDFSGVTDPVARKALENQPGLPSMTSLGDIASEHGASPGLSTALAMVPTALSFMAAPRSMGPEVPRMTPQGVVDQVASRQSGGAAGTAANVSEASLPLQSRIAEADPAKIDAVALNNHLEADQHGIQLTKGQANRDPIQYSEEQNQSTHPIIAKHLNEQNGQMVDAIDNIRREASPTTVGNDSIENGRTVVDALKAHDEPIQADIKAKYQKLTDANGGSLPIDSGSFLNNVDTALKKQYLTGSIPKGADELLNSLRAGEPLDFEGFEAARSRLAEAQRSGGSEAAAAKIIRGQLEQMPLSPEASNLKGLADQARAAAKARFDALDKDPAYQAAVDDVANGNKRGSPSPLADNFLDKYALSKSAPKANIDLMMSKLDDDAKGAVASHTLNAIRKAGVNPSGNVLPNAYNGAMEKYGPKLESLVAPETKDSLESLGRVISNAKVPPPGSSIAPKSGVIVRDALQGAAEHALNAKTMGGYGVVKKMLTKDGFAKEATAPGAGIER